MTDYPHMLLIITVQQSNENIRTFSLYNVALEESFDALTIICRNGDRIIEAKLIVDNQVTRLPVEAFDGKSFSPYLTKLNHEWQQLLAEPLRPQVTQEQLLTEAVNFQSICLARINSAITFYQQQVDCLHQNSVQWSQSGLLLKELESTLARYRITLANQLINIQKHY